MEQFISVLVGLVAIPAINFLKGKLGWEGKKAALLAAALSVVISLVALFAYGRINLADFTVDKLIETFGLVYATATIVYKMLA